MYGTEVSAMRTDTTRNFSRMSGNRNTAAEEAQDFLRASDNWNTTAEESQNFLRTSGNQETSIEEYKLSIYKQIDGMMAKSVGAGDMVWVSISEECFQNMQRDPAYEAWVLDKVRQACASCGSNGVDYCSVLKFGATKEDYKETSQCFADKATRKMLREKEAEARRELQRKRKKQQEKKMLEAKWYKQRVERNFIQLKIQDHRKQVQEENKAVLLGKDYDWKDHRATMYATAQRRAAAYEATFVYHDNTALD